MSQEVETGLQAGTWTIDATHSEVAFTVRHLMSKVRGTFTDFSGEVVTTSDDPTDASVSVAIKVPSINTNNEQRDGHLKSADFFETEAGQEITFVSTGIKAKGDDYVITGDLSINGVTRSVELAAEFFGVSSNDMFGTRLGAEAKTSINRADYNVSFNIPLEGDRLVIGDKVDIALTIEAVKA